MIQQLQQELSETCAKLKREIEKNRDLEINVGD